MSSVFSEVGIADIVLVEDVFLSTSALGAGIIFFALASHPQLLLLIGCLVPPTIKDALREHPAGRGGG